MSARMISYSLVAIQFTALAALALTGPWLAGNGWLLLEIVAILLGLWSIVVMRVGNFNITPNPKQQGVLIQQGPYRWVRHPMYLALILLAIALIGYHFTWLRLVIGLILAVDLVVKLNYEERLLVRHFSNYEQFRQQTWRLVPYLY